MAVSLFFKRFKSGSSVNLKGCQPHFWLHLLFEISKKLVNLKKKLKKTIRQVFILLNHIAKSSVNLKISSFYGLAKTVRYKMSQNGFYF